MSLSDKLFLRIVGCVTVYIVKVTATVGTNLIPFSFAGPHKSLLQGKISFIFSDINDSNNDVFWGKGN